jgi:hypothetical protein
METRRWLVPFSWGVDMQAIDAVVRLAEGGRATLVAVSLITRPDRPGGRGPRLEHIQQSRDFLEAMRWKAERLHVSLERHEVITVDVMQSIATLMSELCCDAIVLVSRGEREALLSGHQLKHVLVDPPAALLVLRLGAQARPHPVRRLGPRVLAWLQQHWRSEGGLGEGGTEVDMPVPEGPLWIRTEDYHGG